MARSAAELEERAERAVRRGELLAAVELFESLLAENPDDERVRQRMESVRALLHPSELVNRRRGDAEEPQEGRGSESLSDAEQGELHASAGRFVEALRCYERALAAAPQNELLSERLDELRKLAPPGARADLDGAEPLEAAPPRAAPKTDASRSHKLAHASFAPLDEAKRPRQDPVELLRSLLERVRSGRRGAAPGA